MIAILAFLIWTGLLWKFIVGVPLWDYAIVLILAVALTVFTRWAWAQNEVPSFNPPAVYAPRELEAGEIIDAEIIED